MRVGLSSFLNGKPYLTIEQHYETLKAPPKALRDALFEGRLDVALISAEAFLDRSLRPYPYGIAAHNKTMSVTLYLRKPTDVPLRIAVTTASQTAVTLLRVILTHFWQRPFTLFPSDSPSREEASGYLLIGDEALFHKTPLPSYDLATLWYEATKLPFIFALFAGYNNNPSFATRLQDALSSFFQTIDKEPHKDYFTCLQYPLDSNHFKGLELFNELRQKLP